MVAYSNGARRPVSDCGETRCRGEQRPQSTADAKKRICRTSIKVHRAEYPRNRRNGTLLAVVIPTQQ